ncbi:MAG: hypothetical protein EO766_02865 [Hydrotalea sp. AMD]|uniref:hypothetical protein n=1 Tax=Hydrotalea sp. AMD TaxID=2501297 RepID=UPI0009422D68|nr:hypothetical protein [Hydrotalea sp. AMD]RWZ90362.1 MAG: hypothetical protein EO766_02865 [Hydrotalea sp. AMD]
MTKKITPIINALTIFTIIGCVFDLYSSIKEYVSGDESIEEIKTAIEQTGKNSFLNNIYNERTLEFATIAFQNKFPILLINIVAIILCFYGALKMRKMKKDGFYFWLIGEILPTIGISIITDFMIFRTIYFIALIFPLIFIIFYSLQLKYLDK